jgi:hypothetical protein
VTGGYIVFTRTYTHTLLAALLVAKRTAVLAFLHKPELAEPEPEPEPEP